MTSDKPSQAPCLWCGGEVPPMARPNIVKKYCSFRCKRNASVQRYKERWPERVRVHSKKMRAKRDKVQAAAYFQANKDKIMAQRKAKPVDRNTNRFYQARLRCKELGLPFSVPFDVWCAMTDGTTCFYCDRPATEVDKIVPANGYVCGNIAPCCRKCNTQKSDLLLSDFNRFAGILTAMGVA